MNTKLFPLFIIIIIITTQIPCFFSQYEICNQPFQCGNINTFNYPFSTVDRPSSCGYPGFELNNCNGEFPLLNISSTQYRILQLNYTSQTLTIARHDLLTNNLCPIFLHNTTLNSSPNFNYSSISNYQNLILHYGCNFGNSSLGLTNREFNCNGTSDFNSNLYTIGDELVPIGIRCNRSVVVPVNRTAARNLGINRVNSSSSYSVLMEAVASGFMVNWMVNGSSSNCQNCIRSGGVCGYNQNTTSFVCYCADNRAHPFTCSNGSGQGPSNQQRYLILGASLGITCITIVSIIVSCYCKERGTSNDSDEGNDEILENIVDSHGSLAPKRYTYTQIEKITKFFTDKLGQGGFGSVYKGTLPDGRLVAVKVLTTETNSNGEDFLNEVASISRTSHVNIVNLLGFCYNKNKKALVYEFMSNKSLDKFIYQSGSDIQLGLDKLYEIAVGVARGLEYLHRGCNTRIVHFDIKPQNILLDEDFCPKISDFGLAQLCKQKQSIISVFGTRGTIGYIAPEVFCRNFGPVSHKSDVYSFGMMVLEMAGAKKIATNESSENFFPDTVYEQVVICKTKKLFDDQMMSEAEKETVRKMFLVGFWCIQTVPSERPSMNKVLEMLEGSLQSIQVPPRPFLASPLMSLSGQKFYSSFLGTENTTEG